MPLRLKVPLGIGTMLWGTTWLDKKVNGRLLSPVEVSAIVGAAVKANITFFDTAEGYGGGTCEEMLGAGFEANGISPVERETQFYLVTKFLPTLWRWTDSCVIRAIEESNRRMGVSCCPLYFLHSPVHPLPIEVWIRGCGKAFQQGKIKALGLSNCDADQVRRAMKEASKYGLPVIANQILMNLLVYNSPKLQETLKVCAENGITIVAYSPLGQGLLCDGLTVQKHKSIRLSRMTGLSFDDLQDLRQVLKQIADREKATMGQVALAWVIKKGAIALVGTRSIPQLNDTLGCLNVRLSDDDERQLDSVAKGKHTFEKPRWRRSLFVIFISLLVSAYRLNRWLMRLFAKRSVA